MCSWGQLSLGFRIEGEPERIFWDPEPVELRADDFQPVNRRITKVARAGGWLRGHLREGSRTALEVQRDAALAGITCGALYDAKRRLGVHSDKETHTANGGWRWSLPAWCAEEEEKRDWPEESKIRARLAEALRRSCDVPERSSERECGTDPECRDLPQDSNISKMLEEGRMGSGGGEFRETSGRVEGGQPAPNKGRSAPNTDESILGGEHADSPQDSKILASVNDVEAAGEETAADEAARVSGSATPPGLPLEQGGRQSGPSSKQGGRRSVNAREETAADDAVRAAGSSTPPRPPLGTGGETERTPGAGTLAEGG